MTDCLQIVTTTPSREVGLAIAQALVEQRLAACVQVGGPITSTYHWEGAIETGEEWLCVAKTERRLYAQVEAEIKRLHPYETPEILATEISQGSAKYLAWLASELR